MAGTQRTNAPLNLVPPGRREFGERWSASGVRLRITGRSRLSETIHRAIGRLAIAATATAAIALGLANAPLPTEPVALQCTEEVRWTEPCREAGPQVLVEAVDPPELARRLAANWDFAPDNGLWRAGGAPWHISRRAEQLRRQTGDPELRAAAAASLASVIQVPTSYGAWTTDDDPELAEAADDVASLYDERVNQAWVEHQAAIRNDWNQRTATVRGLRAFGSAILGTTGSLWLGALGLFGLTRMARRYAERPVDVRLNAHTLTLDDTSIPMADLDRVEFRWGRIELDLHDGTRWISRPLAPRNPSRLELLVMQHRPAKRDLRAEGAARHELHRAMGGVLRRVRR